MIDLNNETLISQPEAARRLGVRRETVVGLRVQGLIEFVRIGKRWKTSTAALHRYLNQQAGRPVARTQAPAGAAHNEALRELIVAGIFREEG